MISKEIIYLYENCELELASYAKQINQKDRTESNNELKNNDFFLEYLDTKKSYINNLKIKKKLT